MSFTAEKKTSKCIRCLESYGHAFWAERLQITMRTWNEGIGDLSLFNLPACSWWHSSVSTNSWDGDWKSKEHLVVGNWNTYVYIYIHILWYTIQSQLSYQRFVEVVLVVPTTPLQQFSATHGLVTVWVWNSLKAAETAAGLVPWAPKDLSWAFEDQKEQYLWENCSIWKSDGQRCGRLNCGIYWYLLARILILAISFSSDP